MKIELIDDRPGEGKGGHPDGADTGHARVSETGGGAKDQQLAKHDKSR